MQILFNNKPTLVPQLKTKIKELQDIADKREKELTKIKKHIKLT